MIATIAALIPALRASRVDPMTVLRYRLSSAHRIAAEEDLVWKTAPEIGI
jgi:hypothetical protein